MQSRAALRLPGLQCAAVCRPGKRSAARHVTSLFAVKTRTIEQELRQQRHRTTGRAFGLTGTPGSTGDVEVRPVVLAGEARQETAAW